MKTLTYCEGFENEHQKVIAAEQRYVVPVEKADTFHK